MVEFSSAGHDGFHDAKSLRNLTRIVNGYEPEERPWMAYVQIKVENGQLGRCAGSILNKNWILSAGHCFCESLPCKKGRGGKLRIDYDLYQHVRVVIGMKDVSLVPKYPENARIAEKVIIHPR